MITTAAPPRRDLHLIRLYYFAAIGAGGFLLPFLSLFFRRQGLSGAEIGLLGTVQALVSLVSAPLTGSLSDRFDRPRLMIQIMLLGSGAISLVLGRQDQFLLIAVLVGLSALASAGLWPLSDNLANTIAGRYEDVGFGSIRLWGSLGWSLVTAVAGRFIELLSLYFGFVANAAGLAISAVFIHLLPQQPRGEEEPGTEAAQPLSLRQGIAAIRHNRRLLNLSLGLGFAWLLNSGLFQFEAIFLDELGASESLIGLANALNAIIELPAMLAADRMLKRFSPGFLLRLGLLVSAVRMVGILLFPTVSMIMVMRVLLGIQFSLYSVGIIAFLNANSQKAYRVTALALITVTLRNLAAMFGNPLSGLVYDNAGAYYLYVMGLIGALGGWFILYLGKSRAQSAGW